MINFIFFAVLITVASIHRGEAQEGTEGTEVTPPCPNDESNGQFSHPTYCDQFLNCWNGTAVVGNCEHGLFFNPSTSSCDYPNNVDCQGKIDSRPQCDDNGFCPESYGTFENPHNCGQFVICQGGVPTFFNCPPTLVYNSTLGVCVESDKDSPCLPPASPTPTEESQSQPLPDDPIPSPPPAEEIPDINFENLKPMKPVGPKYNESNSILFPVIPGHAALLKDIKCPPKRESIFK